jgi:galactose mutarotase-like enzyme
MISNLIHTSYKNSRVSLNLQGGALLSWVNNGREVFYQGSTLNRSGVPILFPFANPLENGIFNKSGLPIGQHGFARNSLWRQVLPNNEVTAFSPKNSINNTKNLNTSLIKNLSEEEKPPATLHLILNNEDISAEMQLAYPFKFVAEIEIDIKETDCLVYTLKVTNIGAENLPISPGLHPYFPINHTDKSKLQIWAENFDSKSEIKGLTNNNIKPEANIIFNGKDVDWNLPSNGIFNKFNKTATAIFTDKTIRITETSLKPDIQNLVVWSQTSDQVDYNFVCLEQFTRETNAINTNPILVKPQHTWTMQVKFEVI